MRKLLSGFLTTVFLLTGYPQHGKPFVASNLDEAMNAQKMLVCIDKKTGENLGGGSASIIWSAADREWLLLTAHHVIYGCANAGGETRVFEKGKNLKLTVVKLDAQHDLALMRTKRVFETPVKYFELSLKEVKIADTVYTIGFPGPFRQFPDIIVTKGIVNNPLAHISGCEMPKDQEDQLDRLVWDCGRYSAQKTVILTVLLSDTQIGPGNSGGAIVNEDFELIGVTVGGASMGNWRAFSVPLVYINDLLRSTEYSFLVE